MEISKDLIKNYPSYDGFQEESLDANSSIKKVLDFVGNNKQVIDFGCATGYLAQFLNRRGCRVTGVEINSEAALIAEQHCQKVIVADLDFTSVTDILPEEKFDVAVFGDVLEHLRNPWKVLKDTKNLLKEDGYVVASIPNIAHGAVRLALLQGRFEYMELGILDNTHLRFFTKKTIEDLFESSGYIINDTEYTKLDVFSGSGLIPQINQQNFNREIIETIQQDENSDVLQFIIKASTASIEAQYLNLKQQHLKLLAKYTDSQVQLQESYEQVQEYHKQLEENRKQLEEYFSKLHNMQIELQQVKSLLEEKQIHLQTTNETIQAMESSKFWKLRMAWLRLKKLLHLN